MPRYQTASGVVVEISEEKASRVPGLKPVTGTPARKAAPKKQPAKTAAAAKDDDK